MQSTGIAQASLKPRLVFKTLPSQVPATQYPLVLLHGWGCDSAVWGDFANLLASHLTDRDIWLVNLPGFGGSDLPTSVTLDAVLVMLADTLPSKISLLGWSLGGMIATAFAEKYADRVESLICLGTNASYVQQPHWQEAVTEQNLVLFKQYFETNPQRCLKRFRASQVHNDQQEKALLQQLMMQTVGSVDKDWCAMLDLLGEIDNRAALKSLHVKTLYLFGERDGLVPCEAAEKIAQLNLCITTEVFNGVSHALHLAVPQKLATRVAGFLNKTSRDKRQVALSFSRSAASYDSFAHLQRATGEQLLNAMPTHIANSPVILDLGCGTGYCKGLMAAKLPDAQIIGLDLAEGMLNFAKTKSNDNLWCCGDAELLPIASNTVDMLFSNLAIQWCDNLEALAAEIYRVLKPGSSAIISSLGVNTLCELRKAWQAVDQLVHVNTFLPVEEIPLAFAMQPFEHVEHKVELRIAEYTNTLSLFRELKALGAHNVNQGRPVTLTGKGRFKRLSEAYEMFRSPAVNQKKGLLPATWEVIYLTLTKAPLPPGSEGKCW